MFAVLAYQAVSLENIDSSVLVAKKLNFQLRWDLNPGTQDCASICFFAINFFVQRDTYSKNCN